MEYFIIISFPTGIKAHFSMDGSGIVSISEVELVADRNITVEEPTKSSSEEGDEKSAFEKIGATLTNMFGG